LSCGGLELASTRPAGQLTRDDRGDQERDKRYPILRIGNREGADRGKEEEVKTENGGDRGDRGFHKPPCRGDQKNRHQVRQRDGRRVNLKDERVERGDRSHAGE
jgi:hypothetical protein